MQVLSGEDLDGAADRLPSGRECHSATIKQRLVAYLGQLGLREQGVVETLADECIHRAKRRAAPGAQDELMRRALEEAQRRFDHAVARVLHLAGAKDLHLVAGARAAFLSGAVGAVCGDDLFNPHFDDKGVADRLRAVLPQPTPPESHLAMPDQHITFLFSSS